jgi:hypothetical protein
MMLNEWKDSPREEVIAQARKAGQELAVPLRKI